MNFNIVTIDHGACMAIPGDPGDPWRSLAIPGCAAAPVLHHLEGLLGQAHQSGGPGEKYGWLHLGLKLISIDDMYM